MSTICLSPFFLIRSQRYSCCIVITNEIIFLLMELLLLIAVNFFQTTLTEQDKNYFDGCLFFRLKVSFLLVTTPQLHQPHLPLALKFIVKFVQKSFGGKIQPIFPKSATMCFAKTVFPVTSGRN